MTRPPRRRQPWKPRRQAWSTALGLANALALLLAGTAGLGIPDQVIRWIAFAGAFALIVRGVLEQEAQQEALRTKPPMPAVPPVPTPPAGKK